MFLDHTVCNLKKKKIRNQFDMFQLRKENTEWLKTIIPVNDPDTYNKITALIPPIENFDIEAVVLKYN